MASDPTDLIRAVDERHHLVRRAAFPGGDVKAMCDRCVVPWPCEVRRLRDELDASEAEREKAARILTEQLDRERRNAESERFEATRELVEVAAALERVRALAEQYDDQCGSCGSISGGRSIAEDLRRAIEGPAA